MTDMAVSVKKLLYYNNSDINRAHVPQKSNDGVTGKIGQWV